MNLYIIRLVAFCSILVSPLSVLAQDAQYPAADFQPKVIFSADATAQHGKADDHASSAKHAAKKDEVDPQHPAAFFQPKVIYP